MRSNQTLSRNIINKLNTSENYGNNKNTMHKELIKYYNRKSNWRMKKKREKKRREKKELKRRSKKLSNQPMHHHQYLRKTPFLSRILHTPPH